MRERGRMHATERLGSRLLAAGLAAAALTSLLATAPPPAVAQDAAALRASLEEAASLYREDPEGARELAGQTFLRFESSGLDRSLAARDPGAYRSLEVTWLKLVSAMRRGASAEEVAALDRSLVAQLAAVASPPRAPGSLLASSLVIILREGFEAILILSAVAASLRVSGRTAALPPLYAGAGFAVAASLGVAGLARALGGFGASGEALEGITCLVAVAVLFLTSYWLISRVEGQRWQRFIHDRVNRAAEGNRRSGLFLLAFAVVFREGFETVLFYQAMAAEAVATPSGGAAVTLGFAVGVGLLALLWAAISWFGVRIPIRQFFVVTGALLYVLAIKFTGVGIRELQEAGWLVPAPVGWLPEISWLGDWLGVAPDAQVLSAQGALVAAVAIGLVVSRRKVRRREKEGAARAARQAA